MNTFYRLAYELHKRWEHLPASENDWMQLAKEATEICSENGNNPFLIDLVCAVCAEIERQYKAQKGCAA